MRSRFFTISLLMLAAQVFDPAFSSAVTPPRQGKLPDAYYQKLKSKPDAFRFTHSFLKTAQRVQINRQLAASKNFVLGQEIPGGLAVSGEKTVYVIPVLFADTAKAPFASALLETELFGTWPTGTMTDFYRENSYGRLVVKGSVVQWKSISRAASYYGGPDYRDEQGKSQHCFGLCQASKIGELLTEALDIHPEIDWGPTDNDGPDGKPNSGDDDGFVDFVAFVHPGKGGECGDNQNIWSHRGRLSDWLGQEYTTKTDKKGGGKLKIDDYVIMPALACDGSTMIQIGVFAHEFGHAFGLPDLYDTSRNPQWNGLGNWDLMAAGGWGGDDHSPESPTHMSAWSKEFLGWVDPIDVDSDMSNIKLKDWETTGTVYRMRISPTQYYLITNREPKLFDSKLPGGGGLLIEYVNERKVQAGLTSNTVNNDPANKGVAIIEADGVAHLDDINALVRADAGDLFPGTANIGNFDIQSIAKPVGSNAVCGISKRDAGIVEIASFRKSSQSCSTGTANNGEASLVSLSAIERSPETWLNRTIRVVGTVRMEGTNYFTNAVPIIVDDGQSLYIQIRGPLDIQQIPPGDHPPPRLSELSDLIGRQVEIRGTFTITDLKNRVHVFVLRPDRVTILK